MAKKKTLTPTTHAAELVPIAELKEHERNYRSHPDDQLAHLVQSIREHGLYRNVVVARDGTVLAGHGVVQAAKQIGLESISVIRLDIAPDDPKALKILTGDNELGSLAEVDDRVLSELLKEISELDPDGLLGTGFDNQMLANLVLVTRPASEIADADAAAAWAGMPAFDPTGKRIRIVVSFENEEDRASFLQLIGSEKKDMPREALSIWWPEKKYADTASLRFEMDAE